MRIDTRSLRPGVPRTASWSATLLLALVARGCGGDNGGLAVAFDGERCDYEGPDRVPAGELEVRFTNDSDEPSILAFLSVPVGMEVDPGVGEDGPITTSEPPGGIELVGSIELLPGAQAEVVAVLAPGIHTLDCVTFGPNGPDHFWRGAILEVDR